MEKFREGTWFDNDGEYKQVIKPCVLVSPHLSLGCPSLSSLSTLSCTQFPAYFGDYSLREFYQKKQCRKSKFQNINVPIP